MKKVMMLLALTMIMVACGQAGKEEAKGEQDLVAHYLKLKDALVETNASLAQKSAEAFLKASTNQEINEDLKLIVSSDDIATQRKAFEGLSMNMYSFVKANGSGTLLYKQYCPMAFNDKGAYWLAAEEEVNNPYFGDLMLHCGFVQDVIEN